MNVVGAIIAGGASTRYGSPKALARVGGVRIIDRVAAALRAASGTVLAIVNDAELADEVGLPHRADVLHGAGALAGVHAALVWARELGADGVIAAGCDMPFLSAGLLRSLVGRAAAADVVVPESDGPRGVEPLCAYYAVSCIAAIERAAAAGDRRMIGFFDDVRVERMPLADVRTWGDPALLFSNINSPADLAAAERALAAGAP